jgi:hypothetical protein
MDKTAINISFYLFIKCSAFIFLYLFRYSFGFGLFDDVSESSDIKASNVGMIKNR